MIVSVDNGALPELKSFYFQWYIFLPESEKYKLAVKLAKTGAFLSKKSDFNNFKN